MTLKNISTIIGHFLLVLAFLCGGEKGLLVLRGRQLLYIVHVYLGHVMYRVYVYIFHICRETSCNRCFSCFVVGR